MTDHLPEAPQPAQPFSNPFLAAIDEGLGRPVSAEARRLTDAILARHRGSVAAVLFYGSCLRSADPEGILDVYVLTTSLRGFHRRLWPSLFNALLPPNVSYLEVPGENGRMIRAKVAVMGLGAFARAMRPDGLDTTLWARFCQPAALIHADDRTVRGQVVEALADAMATAAGWAVRLGPETGTPADYWTTLFRHTYGAELRVESRNRPELIYGWAAGRYDELLRPALARAGIVVEDEDDGCLRPLVADRSAVLRRWRMRRRFGKPLNVLRLVKAAFTFENGVDYLLWKLERHSGRRLQLTGWQRRHPVLAAPGVLFRLYRDGTLR
ncbi:hypothetical protein [Azospirillum picis]|uniref:Phosphatidate cytidylyltransferase n=1 Tax=Azospirillum picis TaxID=488438 RepID=A0ABU0MN59_9PROT|nr:hypothetical protein [Azospirillum picis]MBP2301131.1 hypothetical protein [Azospirillum picis]MDQ0534907.1 hypothetical protein [Azospirillum picis]